MLEHLQIQSGFISKAGRRDTNQDYIGIFIASERQRSLQGSVAAIADGMGGANGGRQAAETTVRGFLDGYYSLPETLGVERAAARSLTAMNRWVYAQRHQDPELENMATTFSALILRGRQAHVIHIGDTRIYRLRDHRLQCFTTDHVHDHPDMRHVLHRAVGLEGNTPIDYALHSLKLHDRFLLCSDGVHGVLSNKHLRAILAERSSPEESAKCIIDSAMQAGSQDNISALVLDIIGMPPPDQSSLTAVFEALPIMELPKIGDQVDGFQLNRILSNGRYSRLFQAWDNENDCEVVLKFPHPRVMAEVAQREAFAREAWITERVHSPWVLDIIQLPDGRRSGLYEVMPNYQGETLEQRLLRSPAIQLKAGVEIGINLAKAVYALNRLRIVHRDIKPENVILLADGGLKLLDLGVARLPGIPDTAPPGAPGTPSYMAPELFSGGLGDERSDVYALGVTLYRMFSAGRYPYGEIEAFSQPRFTKRTALIQHRPDLPAWLDMVVARATEVAADKRFADAMELAFELEDGLACGAKIVLQKRPLIERHPVRFWQAVSALLALMLLAVLAWKE